VCLACLAQVCPKAHVGTVSDLRQGEEDHALVVDMLTLGRSLLEKDVAPGTQMQYTYGFHVPPFNSVDHLHLHCLTLPFSPTWKRLKYTESMLGSWLPAEKCLEVRPHMALDSLAAASILRCGAPHPTAWMRVIQRLRPEDGAGGGDGGPRASPRAREDGDKPGSAHQ
jgi:hypothetical protein